MAYGRITQKQSEILEYIKSQILNKGYPPSVRDICQAVNLKSTSSVHAHLESLEKNGYIRRDPTKSRTISPPRPPNLSFRRSGQPQRYGITKFYISGANSRSTLPAIFFGIG